MLHPSYSRNLIQAINNNAEDIDDNTMMLNSQLFSGTCNQQTSKTAHCGCRTCLYRMLLNKKPLSVAS